MAASIYLYRAGETSKNFDLYFDEQVAGFGWDGQADDFSKAIRHGPAGLQHLKELRDPKKGSKSAQAKGGQIDVQWNLIRNLRAGDILVCVKGPPDKLGFVGVGTVLPTGLTEERIESLAAETKKPGRVHQPNFVNLDWVRVDFHPCKFVGGTINAVGPGWVQEVRAFADGLPAENPVKAALIEALDAGPKAPAPPGTRGEKTANDKNKHCAEQRKAVFDALWQAEDREMGVVVADKVASLPVPASTPEVLIVSVPTQLQVNIVFQVKSDSGQPKAQTPNQLKALHTQHGSAWTMLWFSLSKAQREAAERNVGKHADIRLELRPGADGGAWLCLPNASDPVAGPGESPIAQPHALNLLLEGVPGTGKTFAVRALVRALCGKGDEHDKDGHVCAVAGDGQGQYAITMHPATTYEEFVEGLRPAVSRTVSPSGLPPTANRGATAVVAPAGWFWEPVKPSKPDAAFVMTDGFFVRLCAQAARDGSKLYLVLLDEFNRCNIPKVLGDLLTTLESSKRARWVPPSGGKLGFWNLGDGAQVVTLPGSGRMFFVPDNVYVVATMNSSDRSVGSVDAALRRRFATQRIWPLGFDPDAATDDPDLVLAAIKKETPLDGPGLAAVQRSVRAWFGLNQAARQLSADAMLGHSYLFDLAKALVASSHKAGEQVDRRFYVGRTLAETVLHVWNQQILPQLCESLEAAHKTPADSEWSAALQAAASALGLELEEDATTVGSSLLRRLSIRVRSSPSQNGANSPDGDRPAVLVAEAARLDRQTLDGPAVGSSDAITLAATATAANGSS